MLPSPLHPAIVHFPIVLMILLPIVAIGALLAIRRGAAPRRAWAFPIVLSAVLAGSAWFAVESGESEEEKVERVVPERAIKQHADLAEQFLFLSGAVLVLTAAGLVGGRAGSVIRGVGAAAALGLIVAGVRVGHSGGTLVYVHGAGSAYSTLTAGGPAAEGNERGGREGDERGGDDR